MNPFKGRHFERHIILWAVRWYCKYGISYRKLQEMLVERGVNVDHTTIYRWVQRSAPSTKQWHQFTIARSLQQCHKNCIFILKPTHGLSIKGIVRSDIHGWALSEEAIQSPNHEQEGQLMEMEATGAPHKHHHTLNQ